MLTRVRDFIIRQKMLDKGDKVLAACSGGADSLALVHILSRLRSELGFSLAVAHVDHMFRGAESAADAAYVGEFCRRLGLEFYQTAIDVPAFVEAEGASAQDAGRLLRYDYLRRVAAETGGAKIATGHHRDDQAETVLINLLRGAGGTGLGGMKAVSGDVVRPLLAVSRADIEVYCAENNLAARLDSSNLNTDYLRNYIRLELLPLLREKFNPNLTETLCRTARLAVDEQDFLDACVDREWPEVVREDAGTLTADCKRLEKLHIALCRGIIRLMILKKKGTLKGISFLHVERVIELVLHGAAGSVIQLPGGLVARKGYGWMALETWRSPEATGIEPPGITLTVPGWTAVPTLGIRLKAVLTDKPPLAAAGQFAVFDWQQLTPPLYVRTRQEGDRFQPAGFQGTKKLKDFFIDAKVPRRRRDGIPIISDEQGIVWVAGFRQAARGKPAGHTSKFLHLTIEQED